MTTRPRHRTEALPRRLRALREGRTVIDSDRAELWFTEDTTPFYAIPLDDIDRAALADGDVTVLPGTDRSGAGSSGAGSSGAGSSGAGSSGAGAALPAGAAPRLATVRWDAVTAWFEEDEQVFVHPRDPYRRVDIFASGRRVRWEIGGVALAESTRAALLCETGMPGRWYLPVLDVDMELLRPSDTATGCPYKGEASYWSVITGDLTHRDAVWSYQRPLPEAARIAGMLSAEPDQVTIIVDDVTQPAQPPHLRWLNPSLWL